MQVRYLEKGDVIAIVAPAKGIDAKFVNNAKTLIENRGFNVLISPNCLGQDNYFSGSLKERVSDLQWAIDNDEVKAILCARGGYGCIQILNRINWAGFLDTPKWLIGFSDVTVFHQHLSKIGAQSLHASMPLNFQDNSIDALNSLFQAIETGNLNYEWDTKISNVKGEANGKIVGGNLTVLAGMVGTKSQADYHNKLLFLEDVGEHLYAIDRHFHQLDKSGVLDQIRGLIIGDFSAIKDTNPPFGKSLSEIIKSHFSYRDIPIAFDFPAGHLNDNRALIFGKEATLKVEQNNAKLIY